MNCFSKWSQQTSSDLTPEDRTRLKSLLDDKGQRDQFITKLSETASQGFGDPAEAVWTSQT